MDANYWTHPANSVKITEGQEDTKHTIHVYTDGSKGEHRVGSGIVICTDSNIRHENIQIKRATFK